MLPLRLRAALGLDAAAGVMQDGGMNAAPAIRLGTAPAANWAGLLACPIRAFHSGSCFGPTAQASTRRYRALTERRARPHLTPALSAPRGGEGEIVGAACVPPPPFRGEGGRGRWAR